MKVLTFKIFTTFYRRVVVVVQPIQTPVPELRAPLPLAFDRLSLDEMPDYHAFRPRQRAKVTRRRRSRGDECFVARHEGRIVHATWVATGRVHVPYMNRDLVLGGDEIYLHDAYTLPAYRGYNIAPLMFAHIMRHYLRRGFRHFLAVAAAEKARRRFYEKYGGRVVGVYNCVRLGRWQAGWQRPSGDTPLPFVRSHETRDANG